MSDKIPLFKVLMTPEARIAAMQVLGSGYIGQGSKVEEFEAALATQFHAPVLTLNSCTSAIDLALHLIGVGPGDEVISTAQTCTATNSPVVTRGAKLIWADVDPRTGLIDPKSVAQLITPKTKAIIAVDWSGIPCDYKSLKAFGLPVIEDAAHAFDAYIGEQTIAEAGGDYVCWSFQAIKHLTTVDGGAIKVPPEQLERARLLRWYGLDRRGGDSFRCAQNIQEIGYKYHMNDVAAAIGCANLRESLIGVARHRMNARFFKEKLGNVQHVVTPDHSIGYASFWIYTLLVDDRDSFVKHMTEAGIATSPVHARNDKHAAFQANSEWRVPHPGLDHFADHQIAIPVGWWLSQIDCARIAEEVIRWSKTR